MKRIKTLYERYQASKGKTMMTIGEYSITDLDLADFEGKVSNKFEIEIEQLRGVIDLWRKSYIEAADERNNLKNIIRKIQEISKE
jgi:hypothetical protein